MQKISTEADGVFKDGVPGVSRGTKCNAAWHNAVQEELCNLIVRSGGTLDPNNNNQLFSMFREFLDGIFSNVITVKDPLHSGVLATIEPNEININGIILKKEIINEIIVLTINECLKIAKNVGVIGNLTVNGESNLKSIVSDAAAIAALVVSTAFTCNGRFVCNGDAILNGMKCNSAILQNAVSATSKFIEYAAADTVNPVVDADFANGNRLRVVITSGLNPSPSKGINIEASAVEGRSVNVVNLATGNGGFVYVKNANNDVLCVLAPGVDRWFTVAGNVWMMDRNTVG
jgi:hypothetical protein